MRKTFLTIALGLTAIAMPAQQRWAVVEASAAFLRNAPDYEAALETQMLMGSIVEIQGSESYWFKVHASEPEYTAWVTELAIVEMSEAQKDAYIKADKYICTAELTHIFTEPSENSARVGDFVMGNLVRQVKDSKGKAVKKGSWLEVQLPSGKTGFVKKTEVADFDAWKASRVASADNIISTAMLLKGVPYMWGGTSVKGVDCSGLTRTSYFMNGLLLPRNASQQVKCGIEVSLDELQPGDLLFFGRKATPERGEGISHVAMYIGDGKIIHSSLMVRINTLNGDGEDAYKREVLHARRIIGYADEAHGVKKIAEHPFYE